jgi:hypothetical protein
VGAVRVEEFGEVGKQGTYTDEIKIAAHDELSHATNTSTMNGGPVVRIPESLVASPASDQR